MSKKNKIRVAIVATLSIVAIVLGFIAFQPQNETQGVTDITPVRTPDVVTFELVVTPSPTPPPMPTEPPVQSDEGSSVEVAIPKQSSEPIVVDNNAWFTLIVENASVNIAYGVDEDTLEDTPDIGAPWGGGYLCDIWTQKQKTLKDPERRQIGRDDYD